MRDIVEKSFYIADLMANIRSDSKWTECEIKVVLMLFSKISEYRIYIPDYYKDKKNKIVDKNKVYESLSKVPREYKFSKEEFRKITSVDKSHLSREINKVRKSLVKKTINTPHPMDIDDLDSGETIAWFSKITYQSSIGEILIKVNEDAIDRFAAFVKYTKIDFSKIVAIRNANSIYYYLFFKIIADSSNDRNITISLQEFKDKINLSNKYEKLSHFKEKVLNVVRKEINVHTDLNLDYELIKEGRAFKKIKFTFDYKEFHKKAEMESKYHKLLDTNTHIYSFKSPFEEIFKLWAISPTKINEINDNYSLNAVSDAIQLTQESIEKGDIKKTPAAFFLGILDNKHLEEESELIIQQKEADKKQAEQKGKSLAAEYDFIQRFINDNDLEISKYLAAKSLGAEYSLNNNIKEELANIACVDVEKYKEFRSHLPVLHNGYFNATADKIVRPNMYAFLLSIR